VFQYPWAIQFRGPKKADNQGPTLY
jgi:hypothetical protein